MDPENPVSIGEDVTIGHSCIIHGCTIGDNCLIGMGSIIMNGAKIGDNCLIGAGALITENKEFPAGSKIIGSPAKIKSEVTEKDLELIRYSADYYIKDAALYSKNG
ncbi:MAG: gamma carbonic anhydrase family protein [Parasporobacterium sp.]|nr:gamma carbonic anhydrase family protein [Parasporobacterium sp.]